jgi:hypothetical protein
LVALFVGFALLGDQCAIACFGLFVHQFSNLHGVCQGVLLEAQILDKVIRYGGVARFV